MKENPIFQFTVCLLDQGLSSPPIENDFRFLKHIE
jgi:hypothetical protein